MDRPRSRTARVGTSMSRPPEALFSRQPPWVIGFAQRGDELRPAVDHRQAVEMAAVFGRQAGDERRPPARVEAVVGVERAEAAEAGVDQP